MSVRIQLPQMTALPGAVAHPYPLQISFQTREFIQGAVFHLVLMDTASGQRVRQAGAIQEIEEVWRQNGMDEGTLKLNWDCLNKYMVVYERFLNQQALIVMRSHWDWYIRKLAGFVSFSRRTVLGPNITAKLGKDLVDLGRREMPITSQIDTLRAVTGLPLNVENSIIAQVAEMSLVRNLGLHNRWEVDERYLQRTTVQGFNIGELREVEISELESWQEALSQLLKETSQSIAKQYVTAPTYQI